MKSTASKLGDQRVCLADLDDRPTMRGGGALVVMALVAVLLPMIYVLSIGPVVWLANSGLISQSLLPTLEFAYSPLKWVSDNVPIFGPAIEGYVEFCTPAQSVLSAPAAS